MHTLEDDLPHTSNSSPSVQLWLHYDSPTSAECSLADVQSVGRSKEVISHYALLAVLMKPSVQVWGGSSVEFTNITNTTSSPGTSAEGSHKTCGG